MASPGKRSRTNTFDEQKDEQEHMERPARRSRTLDDIQELSPECTRHDTPHSDTTNASHTKSAEEGESNTLLHKQKKFLQIWYEDFAQLSVDSSLPTDCAAALAKVIRTQPHLVSSYIDQTHKNRSTTEQSPPPRPHDSDSYSLTLANNHLPTPTLTLVEKYVLACRRRRSQTDGRRSVNTGPYRCTFGCGYRTKRAFDWRRHEETHEPQELWLCAVCSSQNPFLVNRKDKFLKHVNDKHGGRVAEKVLGESKVAFVPRAELGCPRCGVVSEGWEERCRHVLGHFEEEGERVGAGKRGRRDGDCGGLVMRDEGSVEDEGVLDEDCM